MRFSRETPTPWNLPIWFLPTFRALVVEVFILICIGAAVRVMNAGLACPDWPLCFGDFIPDYHPQVYFEFIHRAMAGVIAIITAVLTYVLVFRSTAPRRVKAFALFNAALLLAQVIFGGLTVLLKLHSYVVATHLTMGTGFFALLNWQLMTLKRAAGEAMANTVLAKVSPQPYAAVAPTSEQPASLRKAIWISRIMLAAIMGQIILGGLVASHYAALVCIDFPTCHGEWFPTFRGIIGLHVIHRLGAYTVGAIALATFFICRKSPSKRVRKLAHWVMALVFIQIGVGIANVLLLTPPLIAVLHLAVATAILGIATRLVHAHSR